MSKAFDYTMQQWVNDRELELSQLRDELSLVKGSQGAEYLRFIGSKQTVKEAAASITHRMNTLPTLD